MFSFNILILRKALYLPFNYYNSRENNVLKDNSSKNGRLQDLKNLRGDTLQVAKDLNRTMKKYQDGKIKPSQSTN